MKKLWLAFLLSTLPCGVIAPLAHADEAPVAAPPRHRLVGVMLGSAQALLWDDEAGEYALRRVGDEILGGRILALEEDHLVLERGQGTEEVTLAAPPQRRVASRRPRRLAGMLVTVAPTAEAGAAAAEGPEAAASRRAPEPAQAGAVPSPPGMLALPPPVGQPPMAPPMTPPVPAALPPGGAPAGLAPMAPPVPAAPSVPAAAPSVPTAVPPAAAPALPAPAAAPQAPTAPAPAAVPAGTEQPPATDGAPGASPEAAITTIPRADFLAEVENVGTLGTRLTLTPQPGGGFRVLMVQPGSFLHRAGLRPGDVVLRIDRRPINGVEDAAAAAAWLRVTDHFSVDLARGGRPLTLRFAFRAEG